MSTYRKVYLDVLSGQFHAQYLSDRIKSMTVTSNLLAGATTIQHNQNTSNIIIELFDSMGNLVYPEYVQIINNNEVEIFLITDLSDITIKVIFFFSDSVFGPTPTPTITPTQTATPVPTPTPTATPTPTP